MLSHSEAFSIQSIRVTFKLKQKLDNQIVTVLGGNMHRSVLKILRFSSRTFTFSDKDPHHVEIAFFAGLPDVVEAFLNFLVL